MFANLVYKWWPEAAKYGSLSQRLWWWKSKCLVLSVLINMQIILTMRKYRNHNIAVLASENLSFYWLILASISLTSMSFATSSNEIFYSFSWSNTCKSLSSFDLESLLPNRPLLSLFCTEAILQWTFINIKKYCCSMHIWNNKVT